jgi:hypothetical protein
LASHRARASEAFLELYAVATPSRLQTATVAATCFISSANLATEGAASTFLAGNLEEGVIVGIGAAISYIVAGTGQI